MTIYLGTAGIPVELKGESTLDAPGFLKKLGLNAMEVEFVRGVRMSGQFAREVGLRASENGVRLSVHAPYFINLCSDEKATVDASKKRIVDSAERAEEMGADTVAIHLAYYGNKEREQCYRLVRDSLLDVGDSLRRAGIRKVVLGGETMAKAGQFGTLDELLRLKKEVDCFAPYIDWGHIYARNGGHVNYGEILSKLSDAGLKHVNSHFEGVQKRRGKYVDIHDGIGVNAPPYEPLAHELVRRKTDITLICESPYLEHDALKMRSILLAAGYM